MGCCAGQKGKNARALERQARGGKRKERRAARRLASKSR